MELDTFVKQENFTIDVPENIYLGIISEHAVSIAEGKPFTGEDGLHNVRLCEAAHVSTHQGGAIVSV